jgi:hypothetical protein
MKEILPDLRATGLPWSIKRGKRHLKIIVGGKFVGILPLDGKTGQPRELRNLRSQIRRAAKPPMMSAR